jgi:hypothetical protein
MVSPPSSGGSIPPEINRSGPCVATTGPSPWDRATVPCLHRFGASMPNVGQRAFLNFSVFPHIHRPPESKDAGMLAPARRCSGNREISAEREPALPEVSRLPLPLFLVETERRPCRRACFWWLFAEGVASCRCATRPPDGRATPQSTRHQMIGPPQEQQSNADNRIDMKERQIHPREIVWPNEGMLVRQ